jgi:uncharacterized protein (TIGR00296 family)
MLTLEQGIKLVRLSRETLENFIIRRKLTLREEKEEFMIEKRGVFVTLNMISQGEKILRGCIGYPYPVKPLSLALQEVTVAAASQDPRFKPVEKEELDRILVEVSVLTLPEEIKVRDRKDLPKAIRVGVDGLIVSRGIYSGLLLPQVATEYQMDAETFLSEACMKAGIPPDSWLLDDVNIYTFKADIFSELQPRGKIVKL